MVHDGKYITLEIEPTINKDDTEYRAEGQWVDSQNISFEYGKVKKRDGYRDAGISEDFIGVARDIMTWKEISQREHVLVATHLKLEIEQGGTKYDITPITASTALVDAIITTSGSTVIQVCADGHGVTTNDYVVLSTDATVGGVDYNGGNYVVTSTLAGSIFLETSTTATGTSTGGGNIVLYELLESGLQEEGAAYGYGGAVYGVSCGNGNAYGEPRCGGILIDGRQWSLDNFGEDALACVKGGNLFHWDATTSVETRAVLVSAAPLSNNVMFVHPNRHVVLLGTWPVGTSAIDPLQIRWSDREDFNEWAVSAGTRAGSFRLQGGGSEIVGYSKSKKETLVFTNSDVWSMQALNNEAVFGFKQVGTNVGLIAQHAAVNVEGITYWMGQHKFYVYDGRVRILDSKVEDYVFDNINRDQAWKTFAGIDSKNSEIIWFYQDNDSSNDVNRYVKYNWDSQSWDIGEVDRTVWEDSTTFDNALGVDVNGKLYNEGVAVNADTSAMKSYVETSYFDIDDGTEMVLLDQVVPDVQLTGQMNLTVFIKKWPGGTEEQKGPFQILPTTEKISLRARGRQIKLRYSTSAAGTKWELGKPRYRIKTDGER